MNTPTLWLLGLDDHSIPVQTTLRNLKTLASSGRPFEWRTYEGLDHALSPAIWEDVGRWLERFGARPQPPTFAPPSPSKDR